MCIELAGHETIRRHRMATRQRGWRRRPVSQLSTVSPVDEQACLSEPATRFRIVHVITRLINGGADVNTVLSCNYAVGAGHKVMLIHGAEMSPEIRAEVDRRVHVHVLPTLVHPISPWLDVQALRDLVQIFGEFQPDVVHTHTSKAGILGRLAARLVRVPIVVHGVHIVPFVEVGPVRAVGYRWAERLAARMTHAFLDVSSGVRDLYIAAGIGAPERHHLIPSGFDVGRFREAEPPDDWRDLLRLGPGEPRPPVLLMLAAFEERKRHMEFVESLPTVVARFPDVRVILGGDGTLRESVAARIEALGLGGHVVLAGFYRHPERLIALADVCLLTSVREGLPRVVVQYLAGGKPVVASELPGLDEVVAAEVSGIITPPARVGAVTDAAIALLENNTLRAKLACGAAATDVSAWDAELMVERIHAVYAHVAREHRRGCVRDAERAIVP